MNMPFELGVEYGSRRFGPGRLKSKRCLVLEKDAHDFQKAISDLAGIDIKRHNDKPADIVRATRDWFVETVGLRGVPSATRIWNRFTEFALDFYEARVDDGFSDDDLNMMPVPEYIHFIQAWWRR
jgi:hypothetical protein